MPRGYGMFNRDGGPRNVYSHRYAWEQANGVEVPPATQVQHTCDVRRCVNPEHLKLGRPQDNSDDMVARGRQRKAVTVKMGRPKTLPPLRSGGRLWGPHRIALGVSLRELQKRSGVSRGLLSMMESGRMVPTGDEFDRVMQALDGRPPESKDSII